MNSNLPYLNSTLSVIAYWITVFLNYLPSPQEVITAIIMTFIVSWAGFFATRLIKKIFPEKKDKS